MGLSSVIRRPDPKDAGGGQPREEFTWLSKKACCKSGHSSEILLSGRGSAKNPQMLQGRVPSTCLLSPKSDNAQYKQNKTFSASCLSSFSPPYPSPIWTLEGSEMALASKVEEKIQHPKAGWWERFTFHWSVELRLDWECSEYWSDQRPLIILEGQRSCPGFHPGEWEGSSPPKGICTSSDKNSQAAFRVSLKSWCSTWQLHCSNFSVIIIKKSGKGEGQTS